MVRAYGAQMLHLFFSAPAQTSSTAVVAPPSTSLALSSEYSCWEQGTNDSSLQDALEYCAESISLKTSGTGCCNDSGVVSAGRCDPCSGNFYCEGDYEEATSSSHWGVYVALVADIAISVGLLLQKVAHNRVARMHQALGEEEEGGEGGVGDTELKYARLPVGPRVENGVPRLV